MAMETVKCSRTASLALSIALAACYQARELPSDGGATSAFDARALDAEVEAADADDHVDSAEPEEPTPPPFLTVRDTLGFTTRYECSSTTDDCFPMPRGTHDVPTDCDYATPYIFAFNASRMYILCASCWVRGGPVWIEQCWCRPVVCSSDADCRWLRSSGPRYRCVNGLCQDPGLPLKRSDVTSLCLADTPRPEEVTSTGHTCPTKWSLLETACDSDGECRVPRSCRQP